MSSPRLWDTYVQWSRALRSLTLLEDLRVETAAMLIPRPGDKDQEFELICRWLTGCRNFSEDLTLSSIAHPKLAYIELHYDTLQPFDGTESHWRRKYHGWDRVIHYPGRIFLPPPTRL